MEDKLFVYLYDTYKEPLRSYLLSLGVSSGKLEDIIQESFVRLYHRIYQRGQAIEREKLVAYLYAVARNLAIDHFRHEKRVNRIETDAEENVLQSVADPAPTPEEVYEEKELQEDRAKAIEKLPQKIAEAVKGLLEGKSLEAIAQELGIQVPALRYRLRKAKEALTNMHEGIS